MVFIFFQNFAGLLRFVRYYKSQQARKLITMVFIFFQKFAGLLRFVRYYKSQQALNWSHLAAAASWDQWHRWAYFCTNRDKFLGENECLRTLRTEISKQNCFSQLYAAESLQKSIFFQNQFLHVEIFWKKFSNVVWSSPPGEVRPTFFVKKLEPNLFHNEILELRH